MLCGQPTDGVPVSPLTCVACLLRVSGASGSRSPWAQLWCQSLACVLTARRGLLPSE